jgi:hypothetical protein
VQLGGGLVPTDPGADPPLRIAGIDATEKIATPLD